MFGLSATPAHRSSASSYLLPLLVALLLHAVIFWVFTGGLESWLPRPQPEQRVYKVVKASLVSIAPKEKKSAPVVKKVVPKPVSKPKPPVQPKQVKPREEVKQKPETKPEPVEETPDTSLLEQLLAEEDEALRQEQELSEVQRYSAMMGRAIEQNWNRPPSARNNMQAVLKIQLVPSGDVVSVTIYKGSGNAAFDRAAILAVERVGRFEFLRDMSSALFEKEFRSIELTFRPEDLRL